MTVEDEGEEAPARPRRRGWWRPVLIVVALIAVPLTLINASWLAARPEGRLTVVANGGIVQPYDRAAADGNCTATRIKPHGGDPDDNNYIENTLSSLYRATRIGADALEVPVRRTRDGQVVLFEDATLDCRTNGHGPLAAHRLAELKQLDVGYGYTADGGRTFPLRGRGIGGMPTVEELLREVPTKQIIFDFRSRDPADADALAAAFRRAGVAIDDKYAFFGDPAVTARIRALVPNAWIAASPPRGTCLQDYMRTGWTGFVPASCRDATVAVTLDKRWKLWGWPYRFLARMAQAHARVLIYGEERNGTLVGLERPEQYDQVPADFHGWLWAEDFYRMGPDLRR
jgi:glycerophosphoryl diester phosphodiesterase